MEYDDYDELLSLKVDINAVVLLWISSKSAMAYEPSDIINEEISEEVNYESSKKWETISWLREIKYFSSHSQFHQL